MSMLFNKLVMTLLGRYPGSSVVFNTDTEMMAIKATVPGLVCEIAITKKVDLFDVGQLNPKDSKVYWDEMLEEFIDDFDRALRRQKPSYIPGRMKTG